MNDCKYCSGFGLIIFETKYWKAILNKDQQYLGRSIIALKRHCNSLPGLSTEEWKEFAEVEARLEKALKKAFGAEMFNLTCMMNNEFKSEKPSPHVHWHLRPRYRKKVDFEGLAFEDEEFGKHYDRERKRELDSKLLEKMQKSIFKNLD